MLADVAAPVQDTRPGNRAEKAQRELARRRLAQRHLIDFCCYVDHGAARDGAEDPFVENRYRAAHLQLIAHDIEAAIDGSLWRGVPGHGTKVLMVTTPPGHWKSSLVSRKFPAWFIGRQALGGKPHQVILTSYNQSLATSHNRAALELVRDNPRYANVFPGIQLSRKAQSSEEWALAGEPFPACVASGVGGGLTGYHGDVAIVDDPIKDRAEANSPAFRQRLWDWWKDVLETRINRGGFIIAIWTRWTEEDPIGKLMQELRDGNSEHRIVLRRLPALGETQAEREAAGGMGLPVDTGDLLGRESGDALWPEEKTAAELRAIKKAYPLTFDSLYQGRPRPEGGHVLGREQFNTLPAAPTKDVRWILATDFAITEKETAPKGANDPDYTVSGKIGLWRPGGDEGETRIVIDDVRYGQYNPHKARVMVKQHMLDCGPRVPMRSGQANIDKVILFLLRQDPQLMGFSIKNLTRKELAGDKVTKAQPWMEKAYAGMVYVVQGAWNDWFFNMIEQFPHGAHDDAVDMVSVGTHAHGLAQRSRKATSARVPGFGR